MLNHTRPLRVAVLCSHRAPGLLYLLNRAPERGSAYEIVCCLTSEQTFSDEVRVERCGIPTITHGIREFYDARGAALYHDWRVRAEYDAGAVRKLEPHFPDVLLLDGYMYLVTTPILKAFPARVLNLHFSDLTIRRGDGGPLLPGIRAVRDTLAAGYNETRATVHLVDEQTDAGPPIVRSWAYPVSPLVADLRTINAADVLKAYVYAHQQWMMRTASGPLLAAALRLIASGAVDPDAVAGSNAPVAAWTLERSGVLVPPPFTSSLWAAPSAALPVMQA